MFQRHEAGAPTEASPNTWHAQEILTFLQPVRRSQFVRAARLVAALSSLKPFCSPASMEADIGGKRASPTADQADEQCLAAQLVQFQCIELLQSYDTRWPHCALSASGVCASAQLTAWTRRPTSSRACCAVAVQHRRGQRAPGRRCSKRRRLRRSANERAGAACRRGAARGKAAHPDRRADAPVVHG